MKECQNENCWRKFTPKRPEQKYCSRSCANGATKNRRRKEPLPECKYERCTNRVKRPSSVFCSIKCGVDFQRRERFLAGEAAKASLKSILLEDHGCVCQICGLSEIWQGKPIVMIMDHIDGNAENNDISNLRLVCPNCDSQLPTFKSRNKGKGRAWRRQRYAEGKSY